MTWDEPELLQHLKTVNPWLVEVIVNMPTIGVSPFAQPRKKPRFALEAEASIVLDHLPLPPFSTHFFDSTNLLHSIPAGIQGARHTHQFGPSFPNLQISIPHFGQFPAGLKRLDDSTPPPGIRSEDISKDTKNPDNIPHWLTKGNHHIQSSKESEKTKPAHIVLFGKIIFPNQPISNSSSKDTANASDANVEKASNPSDSSGLTQQNSPSDGGFPSYNDQDKTGVSLLDMGHCKVFMEMKNVGRTH